MEHCACPTKENLNAVKHSTPSRLGENEDDQELLFLGFPLSTYRSILEMFVLAVLLSAGIVYLLGAF